MTTAYPPVFPGTTYPNQGYVAPSGSRLPVFMLDDLMLGGPGNVVQVSGFDPGSVEIRSQDASNGLTDGVLMGRDVRAASTWTFDLFTNIQQPDPDIAYAQTLEVVDNITRVWRADEVRSTPGAVMPLRYFMAGRWRRVYGRPRRFVGPDGGLLTMQGRAEMIGDFVRVDDMHYDDYERSARVGLIPSTLGGFTVPFETPLTTETFDERDIYPGTFTTGGSAPTGAIIEITGPVSGAWVELEGEWKLELVGTVQAGQTLVVDTRPWARSTTRGGVPVTGMIHPRTALSDIVLRPGHHRVTFGGYGATDSATATIKWRDTFFSL